MVASEVRCRQCGARISEDVLICPHCGTKVNPSGEAGSGWDGPPRGLQTTWHEAPEKPPRWYRSPLAPLAAAVIVGVAIVDGLHYRSVHDRDARQAATATAMARAATVATATAAVRAQLTVTAEARSDEATAVAVQTEVPRAVVLLQGRAKATAIAQATAGARARGTATARAHGTATAVAVETASADVQAAARARETALAASRPATSSGSSGSSAGRWIVRAGAQGSRILMDEVAGIGVVIGTPLTGGSSGSDGAPPGSISLWLDTVVSNGGTATFQSSPSDFILSGGDGSLYASGSFGPPPGSHELAPASVPPHGVNTGFVGFQIPAGPASYTLQWQGTGAAPHTICHVQVSSTGQVSLGA